MEIKIESFDSLFNCFITCVETNRYIQDIDSITNVVQYQPHQHIPHLEIIETGPTGTGTQRHTSKLRKQHAAPRK